MDVPPHLLQPMGRTDGAHLRVVANHDPCAAHTYPAVRGLHQLPTRSMPATWQVATHIFITAAHIQQIERPCHVPLPFGEGIMIHKGQVIPIRNGLRSDPGLFHSRRHDAGRGKPLGPVLQLPIRKSPALCAVLKSNHFVLYTEIN